MQEQDSTQLLPIAVDSLHGFINYAGNVVIEPIYSAAEMFSEDLARVVLDDVTRYIGSSGEVKFSVDFESADSFRGGLARVQDESYKFGYINKSGETVIPLIYDLAGAFECGLAPVSKARRWGAINVKGDFVIEPKYRYLSSFQDGVAVAETETAWLFIDTNGSILGTAPYDRVWNISDGLAVYHDKALQKFGYLKPDGSVALAAKFEQVHSFGQSIAAVKEHDDGGFIFLDRRGSRVMSEWFSEAGQFTSGMCPARPRPGLATNLDPSKWGAINRSGQWLITPDFDEVEIVTDQIVRVAKGNLGDEAYEFGYLSAKGEVIWHPRG